MTELEPLRTTIKRRDDLTDDDFDEMLEEFKDCLEIGEDPEEALQEVFGIEPDWFWDNEIQKVIESLI